MNTLENEEFSKYERRGAYHWEQISHSIRHHNSFVSARYDAVISMLEGLQGKNILDIGGGDGALSYLISLHGLQAFITDYSHLGLKLAKTEFSQQNLTALAVTSSAYNLPFPTGTFDAVVCSEVIEHLHYPIKMLEEANRVISNSGIFIITTPLRFTEKPLDDTHVQEFFQSELLKMLNDCFSNVKISQFAPLALFELLGIKLNIFGGRPIFRYLFNTLTLYLGRNPFKSTKLFNHYCLLIGHGYKRLVATNNSNPFFS